MHRQGSACPPLFLVPLPVFTSSAQPVRAQLWVFNVEAHSAPSSASSGDQTPLQAGSRGCCPTATWGLPTRLHKCISQPQAGRGITCRQASLKTSFLVLSGARGQSVGWKGHLGTGEEPQLPALTLPDILCDLNKGVSSLGLSFPAYGTRGLRAASKRCGLWPLPTPRPPCRHTPPTPGSSLDFSGE